MCFLYAKLVVIELNVPKEIRTHCPVRAYVGTICSPSAQEIARTPFQPYRYGNRWRTVFHNALESAVEFDISEIAQKLVSSIEDLSGVD